MDIDLIQKTTGLSKYIELATAEKKVEIDHLVKAFYNEIRLEEDPFSAASQYIDGLLSAAMQKIPGFNISCTKGCWYCCQLNVLITEVEAKKIVAYLNENKTIKLIDRNDSRCPFLNDENACNIYPVRPLICRKTLVSSNPLFCNTRNGENHDVQLKTDVRVEALVTAFWQFSHTKDIREFFFRYPLVTRKI